MIDIDEDVVFFRYADYDAARALHKQGLFPGGIGFFVVLNGQKPTRKLACDRYNAKYPGADVGEGFFKERFWQLSPEAA